MAKSKRMSDDELLAITGNEIRQSTGYRTGKLSEARRKNLQYYLGRAVGDLSPPEIEGRSSFVDSSVADTVNWLQTSLIKVFTASDSVVEFTPQKQDNEDGAKQVTDYVNHIFYKKNPGFLILRTWIKDALLSKVGILKVMWDETKTEAREEYNGLSDEDMQIIADDEEVEIIEHTARPDEDDAEQRQEAIQQMQQQLQQAMQAAQQPQPGQPQGVMQPNPQAMQAVQQLQQGIEHLQTMPPKMLHDIACKRTKQNNQVRIYNVPPEEFLLNRDAKSIADARFVAHQVLRTISDLRAMGYSNVDDLTSDDIQASLSAERIERITFNDETGWQSGANEVPGDPSQKQIWVTECYMKVDADGDGIAEWRKMTRAGNRLLDNEECDGPPFVSICPEPLPHQFFGLCPADQALEIQKTKTAVTRAILDNLYLSVNGRYFAVDGQVNLDDLLTSRPGGVVRMKQAGMAGRLDQGASNNGESYQLLDYLELQKEARTGLTRNTQGVNADALNQTATGVNITTNRMDSRVELMARQFAETGFKDLFILILKLVNQNQDKEDQIQVAGKWVTIDPRAWRNQYDLTINVGLGTGNKDQQVQHLMALIQAQGAAAGAGAGIVTPMNAYESHKKLAEALGFKQDSLFFSDPNDPKTKQQMPPPPPNPDQAKMQGQMQLEQMKQQANQQSEHQKAQLDDQKHQRELSFQAQLEQIKQQAQQDQVTAQNQIQAEREAQKLHLEMQMAERQAQMDAQLKQLEFESNERIAQIKAQADKEKAELDASVRILIAQIGAKQAADQTMISAQQAADAEVANEIGGDEQGENPLNQLVGMHGDLMQGVAGLVAHLSKPKTIIRDANGRASGIA
jgi:hypothetical protein